MVAVLQMTFWYVFLLIQITMQFADAYFWASSKQYATTCSGIFSTPTMLQAITLQYNHYIKMPSYYYRNLY